LHPAAKDNLQFQLIDIRKMLFGILRKIQAQAPRAKR
jgi:hypothetical protein